MPSFAEYARGQNFLARMHSKSVHLERSLQMPKSKMDIQNDEEEIVKGRSFRDYCKEKQPRISVRDL